MKRLLSSLPLFFFLLAAPSACTSLQSLSITAVPKERDRPVRAEASNTAFLGIHFDNDFANGLRDELRRKCPHGRVTGIYTKYETTWVIVVETRTVTATGYCVAAVSAKARPAQQGVTP